MRALVIIEFTCFAASGVGGVAFLPKIGLPSSSFTHFRGVKKLDGNRCLASLHAAVGMRTETQKIVMADGAMTNVLLQRAKPNAGTKEPGVPNGALGHAFASAAARESIR